MQFVRRPSRPGLLARAATVLSDIAALFTPAQQPVPVRVVVRTRYPGTIAPRR